MPRETIEKPRFEYLDALRGIAAIAVCIHHLFGYMVKSGQMSPTTNELVTKILLENFDFGRFGVVLFFLISGFIIPNSLTAGTSAQKFAISRFFRLYPAYWFTCLLIFVTAPFLSDKSINVAQLTANLTMIPKVLGQPEMSGLFWTLFIELTFYFICAGLFYSALLRNAKVIAAITFVLGAITPVTYLLNEFADTTLNVRFIPFHLSFLFLGSLIRIWIIEKDNQAKRMAGGLVFAALIAIPITTGVFFDAPQSKAADFVMHGARATNLAYYFAIALFITTAIYKYNFGRFFTEMGKVSYSLYLLHMLCFVLVLKYISPNNPIAGFAYIAISLGLAYAVAKLSYVCLELPAVRLGRSAIKLRSAQAT